MQFELVFPECPITPTSGPNPSESALVFLEPLLGASEVTREGPISDGTSLVRAASFLADEAKIPVKEVAIALRAIGYADQVLALGEVLQTLSLSRDRIVALRQVLPNLSQIFSGFELAASLDTALCAPTGYQPQNVGQRYSPCNRTAESNFLQWLLFHYPPQTELVGLANAPPLKLDVLIGWWIYGSAVRLFGDQIPPWRLENRNDRTTAQTDIETLEVFITHTPGLFAIEEGAVKSGYTLWLAQLRALNAQGGPPKREELPKIELPQAIQRLVNVREVTFNACAK